jgi:polyisoprenoid-binding protein YceI
VLSRLFAAALLVPALGLPVAPLAPATAAPVTYTIDPPHTDVSFLIRHFMSRVRGKFTDVRGTIVASPDAWQDATIDVTIATPSISTSNDRRDTHLRSNDFFAADSFPTITFKSTRVERNGDDAKVYGNLTIRGVTRPVVLDGHFAGSMGDRIGFLATTRVNRLDYGVKWNRAAEGGGVMLGDDVTIDISLEAVKAKS